MGRKKAPGSETSSIPLENPERVRGGEKAGGVEGQPGAREGGERQRKKIQSGLTGDKRFEDEGGAGVQH